MALRIVPGTAGHPLATALARCLGLEPATCTVERFPDGELRPRVGTVRGDDVYLVQSTGPPVSERLVELLLLLDACRRAGADRVTAVVPYFGYARQDRRTRAGEAIGARVAADVLTAAGAQRLLVVDPHTTALETMFAIPVEMLTAVPVLAAALSASVPDDTVVVAPDLGAVKIAERVAARLDCSVAVVRKTRISGTSVRATELTGDVRNHPVLIVDDMISTGATIEAAAHILLAHGATPDITVAATHGLLVADAVERLQALQLRRLLVTDSVALPPNPPPWMEVRSIAALLSNAVAGLHRGEALDDLLPQS
ncbi:ribose-phosphate diphosphokinase [Pseudonocardia sp. H11422]|uniref:ribose-phosphate diphosphokinase n=1 Tax=Pseudonocardia sp. H11422 TaxID=2835866 RepID=UPI001BDBFB67|nr:ribose-phosphate pyrophosphokinase [Pseudonocardia sp. H11422]